MKLLKGLKPITVKKKIFVWRCVAVDKPQYKEFINFFEAENITEALSKETLTISTITSVEWKSFPHDKNSYEIVITLFIYNLALQRWPQNHEWFQYFYACNLTLSLSLSIIIYHSWRDLPTKSRNDGCFVQISYTSSKTPNLRKKLVLQQK